MADEAYDELTFTMVNGETHRLRVGAGMGSTIFSDVAEMGWIDVDDSTRIRKAMIVSVRLRENAHEYVPIVSLGDE